MISTTTTKRSFSLLKIFLLTLSIVNVQAAPSDWNVGSFFGKWQDGISNPHDPSYNHSTIPDSNSNPPMDPSPVISNSSIPSPRPTDQPSVGLPNPENTFQVIVVGGPNGLVFTPNNILAPIGSKIFFEFQTKNHSVTQSSFDEPCLKIPGGFDSGFQPSQLGNGSLIGPGFVLTVEDDKPIWFYCMQTNHCPQGMVGAINSPNQDKFDAFVANAKRTAPTPPPTTTVAPPPPPTTTVVPPPIPTSTTTGSPYNGKKLCSLSNLKLTFSKKSELSIPQGQYISSMTVGRGTQNYTCTDGAYVSKGAVAALMDVSCLFDSPYFLEIPQISLALPRPIVPGISTVDPSSGNSEELKNFDPKAINLVQRIQEDKFSYFQLGQHYFKPSSDPKNLKPSPFFDFVGFNDVLNPSQFFLGNLTASVPDSNPRKNVPWLQLNALDGELSQSVFRIVTAGGSPPSKCSTEGQDLQVEYSAFYVFTKSQ